MLPSPCCVPHATLTPFLPFPSLSFVMLYFQVISTSVQVCNSGAKVFRDPNIYPFMSLLSSCGTWGGRDAYSRTRVTVRSSTAYSSARMESGWCLPAVTQPQRYGCCQWAWEMSLWLHYQERTRMELHAYALLPLDIVLVIYTIHCSCYNHLASLLVGHFRSIVETCDCHRRTRATIIAWNNYRSPN